MRPGSQQRIKYYCDRYDAGQPLFDDLPRDMSRIPHLPYERATVRAGSQPERPDAPRITDSEPDDVLELRMVEYIKRYGRQSANTLAENVDACWKRTYQIVGKSERLLKCGGFVTLR